MKNQMRRPATGFTLLEVLVWLGLLGIASVVVTRLFTTSMRVIDRSSRAQDSVVQVDQMITALRADVWKAAGVEVIDDRSLALPDARNGVVRWTIGHDGTVTRSSPTAASEWKSLGSDLRFVGRGNRSVALVTRDGEIVLPNLSERVNR